MCACVKHFTKWKVISQLFCPECSKFGTCCTKIIPLHSSTVFSEVLNFVTLLNRAGLWRQSQQPSAWTEGVQIPPCMFSPTICSWNVDMLHILTHRCIKTLKGMIKDLLYLEIGVLVLQIWSLAWIKSCLSKLTNVITNKILFSKLCIFDYFFRSSSIQLIEFWKAYMWISSLGKKQTTF